MTAEYDWFVGIDWGSAAHEVVLLDAVGATVGTWTVSHTAAAVHECLTRMLEETGAEASAIAVGIETPRGVLIDALLERRFPVFALNPKQLDRFRDRHTVAGAKDDRRDAYVVADSLRTDRPLFRRVRPDDAFVIEAREYAQILDELEREGRRLANQLREHLTRVVPQWLSLCNGADAAWFWEFVADVLTPTGPRAIRAPRIAQLLRAHRITRFSADDVLAVLAQRPWEPAAGTWTAVHAHAMLLIQRLQLVRRQRTECRSTLDRLLDAAAESPTNGEPREHRDVSILRSLPGVGRKVTAAMLGYAARAVAERDYRTLRSYSGVAPVTRRSGKRYHVTTIRYACHPKLRNALHHWAGTSLQRDPAARAYYDRLRSRGCTHARALRSVGDRWLRILMAMLRSQTPYDASRFAVVTRT